MLKDTVHEKKVLFVTTKNLDYIRNTQEIKLLRQNSKIVTVIGSDQRSYVQRSLYVWWRLLFIRASSFDIVFWGFSPQLTLPFFQWKFKKLLQIEDFFISLYDTCCCDRNYFHPDSIAGRILHFLDRCTLQTANLIICDTKSHGAFFTEEFQIDYNKFETLYLEADASIYHQLSNEMPGQMNSLLKKGTNKYMAVLYFGNMLPLQGIEIIAETCEILRNCDEISFTIIGPLPPEIKKRLNQCHNTVLIPYLSQPELAKAISKADLCLAGHFHPTIGKAARTIPGKAFIYQQMHKPMVLGDSPANRELFAEGMPGIYYVQRGNPKQLAKLLLKIYQNNLL